MQNTSIERVMTVDPVSIAPDAPIGEARQLLEYGDVHHLPVVDRDRLLVGIVSSADLLKLHLLDDLGRNTNAVRVRSIMATSPLTLKRSATLREAVEQLSLGGFHALPVVAEDQTLVGIVTSADLGLYLMQHLPRGDGSLRDDAAGSDIGGAGPMSDAEFVDGLRALKAAPEADAVARFARALLAERRMLEAVRKAAELYFRSGQAEREHSKLTKALAAARSMPTGEVI